MNCHAGGGTAQRGVKYMGREPAHAASVCASHLRNLSCMICCCCAAASSNSCAGSLARRRSRRLNISAGCFPLAQTIKIRPKALFVLAMTLSHALQDSSVGFASSGSALIATTRLRQRSSASAHAVRRCAGDCGRLQASPPRGRRCQQSSAAANESLLVRERAHVLPGSRPRHVSRSRRESRSRPRSGGSAFQRSRTRFKRRSPRETPAVDCRRRGAGKAALERMSSIGSDLRFH